jgi:hypothetical protein
MINTYHDVDCFSNDFHDPKTFKDGNNLHQFIIRQQYNDLLKVFNSPSLISEMKSMTVIKQKMKTKDLPDVLNLAYLKQMCAKQLNYIMPLCSDSVLVPLDPLPANQHSPDKNASSSLPETPTNVAEVSSTLLSAPFPTAPADDDARKVNPLPLPTQPMKHRSKQQDWSLLMFSTSTIFSMVSPQVITSMGECQR